MIETSVDPMDTAPDSYLPAVDGDRRVIEGIEYIYCDGYWIRYYAPLEDTLANRKRLIDSLTRRAFHHTEAGINTPGMSLEIARQAYQREIDPDQRADESGLRHRRGSLDAQRAHPGNPAG